MNFSRQRFSGIHKRLSGAQVDSPDKHPGLDRRPCCSVAWLGVAWRQFRCGHSVLHSAIRYLRFINAPEVTTLRHYTNRFIIIIIIIIILSPPAQSRRHKTRLHIQNYGCNGNFLCDYGVVEKNRVSSLQSHRKALEKEYCLPGVFCDSGDTPANLLCELNFLL